MNVAQLAADRALAMRTLMPRAYSERTTTPAAMYRGLTKSGKAEVDRLVAVFAVVRQQAVDEFRRGQAAA